nr:MAG TPA: hypothetical protein [Herelleviridae sp.]
MRCRAFVLSRTVCHSREVRLIVVSVGQDWMWHWIVTMPRFW